MNGDIDLCRDDPSTAAVGVTLTLPEPLQMTAINVCACVADADRLAAVGCER